MRGSLNRSRPAGPMPMRRRIGCGLAVAVAFALHAGAAGAQTAVAPPAVAPPAVAQPAPRHLDLLEFRVDGNTLLQQRDIESALYPFLGPDRVLDDVERARAALEALYAKHGFPTVSATIPPQSGAGGVVVLQVVQRPIGRLRVVGAQYVAPSAIRAATPSLAEGRVPQMADVQSDLSALNQLPDRTVSPALQAGREPDTVDVDLKVDDHMPLHGSLDLNNRRSQNTTALRNNGSLSYDNLWQRGDSVSLGFQVAPMRPNDARMGTVGYTFRLPDSRMSLSGSYVQSDSNVSSGPAGNVVGRGKTAGLHLLMPFGGDDGFNQSLTVGVDYKDLTQDIGSGQFSRTPILYVPFSASYLANWSGARSTTDASATLVAAFRGLGGSAQNFDNKRAFAQPDFAYLKADFSHTHTLPYNIEVYAHGQMQLSPSPLISSEQFSMGGVDSVRGYLESESLGDYGGSGQLELRTPPLAHGLGASVTKLQLLTFLDAGANKIRQPLTDQRSSDTLASAGVGVRMRLFDHVGGEIDDAQVLLNGPVTRNGANRVLFRLYGDF